MDHENHYASNGKGNLGVTLGAIGTGLSVLGGGLGNIFGGPGNGGCCAGEDRSVNRYELGLLQEIAAKDSKIGLLESNIYTDSKIADVYERLNTKIDAKVSSLEAQICQQGVFNATATANINCLGSQIAQLMSLTKMVIPNGSVCPGWGDVTVTPAAAPTTAAAA